MTDVIVNDYQENTYVITEKQKAFVIDPGTNHGDLLKMVTSRELRVVGVLMTHGHFDHMLGLTALLEKWPVPVYIHRLDRNCLTSADANLSTFAAQPFKIDESHDIRVLEGGERIPLDAAVIRVIHTPGHTPGSVCYATKEVLFTGDTLFKETVGRSDLPGGSAKQLGESVRMLLNMFGDETTLYPGHGEASTVGHEKRKNFFYRSA